MIIGLTGGSGSGKSIAAKFFKENGFFIIDFDKLSREVTSVGSECLVEIKEEFGKGVIMPDGSLNRRALGEIVFSDREKLSKLNTITHKYILKAADELISKNPDSNFVFDAPLLFQAGLDKQCDFLISILADKDIRIKRIVERDSIPAQSAENRIDSQPDNSYYIEKSDVCILNNGTLSQLTQQLSEILSRLV